MAALKKIFPNIDSRLQPAAGVKFADNSRGTTAGSIQLTIFIDSKPYRHRFLVLPQLETPVILGVDLWGRTRLSLTPPKQPIKGGKTQTSGSISRNLDDEERKLEEFLSMELDKFNDIEGPTHLAKHEIRLTDPQPIKQRYRPRNPAMQQVINDEVNKMLSEGVIEPSSSAWSSPVVIVRKPDNTKRFCVDFRRLNAVTVKDAYPLPQIQATLDKLRGAQYLSTLDLKSGYWQIPLAEESKPLTAFTVPGRGLLQFTVMPFGLHSAAATFQRLMDGVLGPELEPNVFVYLDNVIIASKTFTDHINHLRNVFTRLRAARLKVNISKCKFCVPSLRYLGHIIDKNGIHTDPEKVRTIEEWPIPGNVRQVRQFLGLASWYRRFVDNFARLAGPLIRLTKKRVRWSWGPEQQNALETLKKALTSAPVLTCPDFSRPFILQTDASKYGLGAVLMQESAEGEKVIAYASRRVNNAEQNYSATELECLAVVWGVRHFRGYLEGYKFIVMTDHQSLKWLQKIESPTGLLARWLFELQQYEYEIQYCRGSTNIVADALSRREAVSALQKEARCNWYHPRKEAVEKNPEKFPDYVCRDGRLYHHRLHSLDFRETPAYDQWKICVPKEERAIILRQQHDEPSSGHMGVAKTISRVARQYFWPGMFRDIARYVRECPGCLANNPEQRPPAGLMHATNISEPWDMVSTDLMGPFPRSREGHIMLIVTQDRFTKWIELEPVRKATAPAMIRHMEQRILFRHGVPRSIVTDNGRQFTSHAWRKFINKHGIASRATPIYTPQCNPVERANRTIKTMIRQYVNNKHNQWDRHIPALQFAYNSAQQTSTGYTPAYLNYGREMRPPYAPPEPGSASSWELTTRSQQLKEAYELVRIHLARAFQKQRHHYDLRRREWRPTIGETVWKREHLLSKKSEAFAAKLAPQYSGPYTVHRISSPVIVDLKKYNGKIYRNIHVRDLKTGINNNNNNEQTK